MKVTTQQQQQKQKQWKLSISERVFCLNVTAIKFSLIWFIITITQWNTKLEEEEEEVEVEVAEDQNSSDEEPSGRRSPSLTPPPSADSDPDGVESGQQGRGAWPSRRTSGLAPPSGDFEDPLEGPRQPRERGGGSAGKSAG